jgi:hypothetical protein
MEHWSRESVQYYREAAKLLDNFAYYRKDKVDSSSSLLPVSEDCSKQFASDGSLSVQTEARKVITCSSPVRDRGGVVVAAK